MEIVSALPPDSQKEFILRHLVKGAVFRRHVSFTTPPKLKFFALVGLDQETDRFKVVLINSEINTFTLKRKGLLARQVTIPRAGHDFLDADSYIDCTELHEMSVQELINGMTNDYDEAKGSLESGLLEEVLGQVKKAATIARINKRIVTQDWDEGEIQPYIDLFFPEE